ncbi:hypothetical protein [Marichromatium bheemlicum]|uniref:Uncharacterized protein n=1 Tax=Marichromatium bheemlicum TaxID=365339 RepID=A0ABX1I810_9GAMM|nr:hypothetical protein [Marichromatium bheemlicum]NKN33647.1 hypothetical protein [Marichromatium bheemlicum]
MHLIVKGLGWLVLLIVLGLAGLALKVALDGQAVVPERAPLSTADHAWAEDWLHRNRPRDRLAGMPTRVALSAAEAERVANHLIARVGAEGRAAVRLGDGRLDLQGSIALPWGGPERYLNLELGLVETDGALPEVARARIAGVPLPTALVEGLAERTLAALGQSQMVQRTRLGPERISLIYTWQTDGLERLASGLIAETDRAAMLTAQRRLGAHLAQPGAATDLAGLLSTLLGAPSQAPLADNRAALLLLALYVNGQQLHDPEGARLPQRTVTLRKREDLAQHFTASAALALEGGDLLSTLVGWYKEHSDSDGGSGFSFIDLAANRAGIRFAGLATATPAQARWVRERARAGLVEDDFMPRIAGLPEGMNKTEFAARFGDTEDPRYRRIAEHIERRLDARPIHRDAP